MESKARGGTNLDDCVRAALRQLATYWYHARGDAPGLAGYGIVIATSLARPRRVCVYFFAPRDQRVLLWHLDRFPDYRSFRRSLEDDLPDTGHHLIDYV